MSDKNLSPKALRNVMWATFAFFCLVLGILIWWQVYQIEPPGPGLWIFAVAGAAVAGFFAIKLHRTKEEELTPEKRFAYLLGLNWVATIGFACNLIVRLLAHFDVLQSVGKPTAQKIIMNILFLAGCVVNLDRLYRGKEGNAP